MFCSNTRVVIFGLVGLIVMGFAVPVPCDAVQTLWVGIISPTTAYLERLTPLIDLVTDDVNAYMVDNAYDYRFEFVIEDAEGQEAIHLEKVEAFHAMGVDLIVGGGYSSHALTALAYVNANNMLMTSPSSTSLDLEIPDDNLFRLIPNNRAQTSAIAAMLQSYGIEACIVLQIDNIWGNNLYTEFEAEFERIGGVIVDRIRYDTGTTDFTPYFTTAEDAVTQHGHDNVVLQLFSGEEVATMITQAPAHPSIYNLTWFGSDGNARRAIIEEESATAADHLKLYSTLAGVPDTAKARDIDTRFHEMTNMTLDFYDAAYYDACWIYALSIIDASSTDPMDIKAVLPFTATNYIGVTGRCTLNAAGDRVITNYDIWGYGLDMGVIADVKYGYYDSVSGQVEWITPAINTSPVVNANGPYMGTVGDSIAFHPTGSYDPDGTIMEYHWDFGDGTESPIMSPNHAYTRSGNFSVQLTIVDDDGAANTTITYCTVSPSQTGGLQVTIAQLAALIPIAGAGAGLFGWMMRTRREQSRRKKLFRELLDGVDDIYTRFKMNARTCEAELYKYKSQIMEEFKQGMIDETSYDLLNTRIDKYLKEIIADINKEL